ncbi:MAG: hypothetical protein ABSH48_10195 [Verrucomicrobiota bacterium]|jgi:hypothetical protein
MKLNPMKSNPMKLNQWALGLAIVGVVGLAPAARAQSVVDTIWGYPDTENFSSVGDGNVPTFGQYKAQLFTAGIGGSIDSLELTLIASGNQSAILPVYIFDLSDSTSAEIGTISGITSGLNNYSVTLNSVYVENDPLHAGDQYRIAVDVSGAGTSSDGLSNVGWVATTVGSPIVTGTGSYSIPDEWQTGSGGNWASATWTPSALGAGERFLDLEVVPEPSTQVLMILTPLAWLAGRAGRWGWRRFKPAV